MDIYKKSSCIGEKRTLFDKLNLVSYVLLQIVGKRHTSEEYFQNVIWIARPP